MSRNIQSLLSVLLVTISAAQFCQAAQPAFPLKVSGNGRYLVDQNNVPFPIFGDAGWETSHNLTPADQTFYLTDRTGRGFNAVLQEAVDHKFNASKPPKDIVGNLPFTTRLDSAAFTGSPNGCTSANGNVSQYPADPYSNINAQAPDFTFPNAAYWTRLDSYITLCAQNGVVVLLFPAYVGYAGGDEGWMQEMVANDAVIGSGGQAGQSFADNTKSRMWNYGAWLANRYKTFSNIIWVHGGDYGNNPSNGGAFTAQQKNAVNNLFAGIKSVSGQQSVLHTAHWSRRSTSTDITFTAGSFDLEATYADTSAAQWGRTGYAHTPAIPSFEIEDYYEGSPSSGEPNRRFAWWTQLSNIGGYFYSSESVWPFDPNVWKQALNLQGAQDAARLNAFMKSIAWQNLVPSGLNGTKTLVTAGGGTANPQSADYVAASAAPDGTILVAYVPPAHSGTITVDMTAMVGSTTARWFNPTTAGYTAIGTFPNTGTQVFTPPGNNGSGYTDWVLVLTASASANNPPTVATPAAANPNPVVGTTTTLSVLGADDGGEPALTYTWSTVGTPPAAVTFSPNGSNSAKSSTATFSKAGNYSLRATITDAGGLSVTSDVAVIVNQTLTSISVSPASASVAAGGTQTFAATAKDQFGQALTTQPVFAWSVSGGGTISTAGVFTAGSSAGGPFTVTAASGGKNGTAAVTVTAVNEPPTVATPAAANPNPVTGTTAALSMLGADDGGEPALVYTWSTVGTPPAPVAFSANGTNAAKNSTATFTKTGSYTLRATITDTGGLTTTSTVVVTVNQTLTTISVSPASASVAAGGTQAFAATAKDQFGQALTTQPVFTWTVSGGGTISSAGLFTAGNSAGGPFTITAASGGKSGTATVTVTAVNHPPMITSVASATPNPATVNQSVAFSVSASDPDADPLIYAWTFGDGVSGSGSSSSHTYAAAGSYTASVTVTDGRGGSVASSVTVTVNAGTLAAIKINFQLPSTVTPAGYLPDTGLVFGDRGNGFSYGWNADSTANARERFAANSPDKRYDTFIHMQKPTPPNAIWEIAVPNGDYSVRIVSGDPSYFDSVYRISAEGVLVVNGTPTATVRWFEGTQTVTVADGRLTISSAAGSVNNKISFIEITTVALRELAANTIVADPMTVSTLQAKMNFAKKNQDSYSVSGVLPGLSADFKTGGVSASIDVGAAIANFTLDAKGRAHNSQGSFLLKHSAQKGWQFKASLKKGSWSFAWSDAGLNDVTVKMPAELPVTLTIGGLVFGGSKTVQYSAVAHKSAIAK